MAEHVHGTLYYEKMGRQGPVFAFIHPNPYDQSCWLYQLAHLSTWFRCIAIDLPGYGRSPKADSGLRMTDLAKACWEAIDEEFAGEPAILIGCSVGSQIVPYMHLLEPERTSAVILSGAAYFDEKLLSVLDGRIEAYRKGGGEFRWDYCFQNFSPAFRSSTLAHYFARLFTERNDWIDVESIVAMFQALHDPYPEGLHQFSCPALVLMGTEDPAIGLGALDPLVARIAHCELKLIPGAGHAAQLEQPLLFDEYLLAFLDKAGLIPKSAPSPLRTA